MQNRLILGKYFLKTTHTLVFINNVMLALHVNWLVISS